MDQNAPDLLLRLNAVTVIACIVISLAAFGFFIYIKHKEKSYKEILAKKLWIEQIPSMVSTLGVLGTFLGITIGLLHFNTEDLDSSIPLLLTGLKTAFLTSLFGMIGSLILNRTVNKALDDAENAEGERKNKESTLNALSNLISALDSEENKEFKKSLREAVVDIKDTLTSVKDSVDAMYDDLSQVKDDIEEIRGHCEEIKNTVGSSSDNDNDEVSRLLAVVSTTAVSIAKIDNDMETMKESSSAVIDLVQSISSDIEEIKQQ